MMGTGQQKSGEMTAAEKEKYDEIWKIVIDKEPRKMKAREEAIEMLAKTRKMKDIDDI